MKNLSIGKRLFVTFGIILVLVCFTVLVAISSLFNTRNKFTKFYNEAYNVTNKASDLRTSIQAVSKYIGHSMMEEDITKTQEYVESAKDEIQLLYDGITYMTENFPEGISLVNEYESLIDSVASDRDRVLELASLNHNQEAIELYFSKVLPVFSQAYDCLTEINDAASKIATENYSSSLFQTNLTTIVLVILSIVNVAIAIFMALYIIKTITYPIEEIEKVAKEMVKGSLSISLDYKSNDELGSLANSIRDLTSSIKTIVEDIGQMLGELATGNFHIVSNCKEKYVLDYLPILTSIHSIRDKLNSTMTKINQAAEQVALGSSQMSESAQGLAEGATDQAGAVEELTATVENVTSMAEIIAADAGSAFERVQRAGERAENGSKQMQKLTEAMESISNTSKEVENIITSIEDIASQTNLLSLNASIEAARAGEAGKGFAVVANQIGKLATDSSQSAINTRNLIVKILEEIETGNAITVTTSEAFTEVIDSMRDFAEVTRNSSESSSNQASSLKQIQQGIEQISSVVQNNSAAAEQTSATSQELSAQSENLKSLVSKFKLLD